MRITTLAVRHRARWMRYWKGNQPFPEEINTIQSLMAFCMRSDDKPGWEWNRTSWNRMSRGYEYPTPAQAKRQKSYFWNKLSEYTRSEILKAAREWRRMQRQGIQLTVVIP